MESVNEGNLTSADREIGGQMLGVGDMDAGPFDRQFRKLLFQDEKYIHADG